MNNGGRTNAGTHLGNAGVSPLLCIQQPCSAVRICYKLPAAYSPLLRHFGRLRTLSSQVVSVTKSYSLAFFASALALGASAVATACPQFDACRSLSSQELTVPIEAHVSRVHA